MQYRRLPAITHRGMAKEQGGGSIDTHIEGASCILILCLETGCEIGEGQPSKGAKTN